MPLLLNLSHSLLGSRTGSTICKGKICYRTSATRVVNTTLDGFVAQTETPDRTLTPDERLTISQELVDILVGWIRNGFTPNYSVKNYLRFEIWGIPDRQDTEFFQDYIYTHLNPLENVFGVAFHIKNWVSETDGSHRIDLITEIALTEEIGMLMMAGSIVRGTRQGYCIGLNTHTS
jgi:hypothetical protein